jgi:hypothetical protein
MLVVHFVQGVLNEPVGDWLARHKVVPDTQVAKRKGGKAAAKGGTARQAP